MKTIIAGSRTITDYQLVQEAIEQSQFNITEVISGTAQGPDILGEQWAIEHNILIKRYKPEWDKYGKSAGYRRNAEMINCAEALIAIWDGKSKGTEHTIRLAREKGLHVYVYQVKMR